MKLEIELIPKTTFFTNVRSLAPEKWDQIRKKCYSSAGYRCEICGGKGEKWPVECHEIWAYDFINNLQSLKGLIALCPSCHEVKHMGLARLKGNQQRAEKHFATVNSLSGKETQYEIEKAFAYWRIKNEVNWKLDTSFLDTYV